MQLDLDLSLIYFRIDLVTEVFNAHFNIVGTLRKNKSKHIKPIWGLTEKGINLII